MEPPPYLVALLDSVVIEDNTQFVNFDSGGTLTPISKNRCIPFNDVLEIASFFFNHRALPKNYKWKEI